MTDGLGARWEAFSRHRYALEPAYTVRAYRNVFAQGYLATPEPTTYEVAPGWERLRLGRWHFQVEPTVLTAQGRSADGTAEVLVLGEVFDDAKQHGPAASHVVQRIFDLIGLGDPSDALERVDEYVTWLSGRFLVFLWWEGSLVAWPDPMASRLCYWLNRPGAQALASHTVILSNYVGGLSADRVRWVMRHPDYQSPHGKWLPGLVQPHDEVGQIFSNARLRISGREIAHERFFPKRDAEQWTFAAAYEAFRDALGTQIKHWTAVKPTTVLGLTAGGDSRALLTTGLDHLQDVDALAMTYHWFGKGYRSTYDDYLAANRLAATAGLRHLVIDVPEMGARSQFGALYTTTFPTWARFANLAMALYVHAPARATMILGIGGEIGTVQITGREETEITPAVLAHKYALSKFGQDPLLHDELAAWIDYANFQLPALRGYDFRDLYYWEHRLSKWAAVANSEYDLAITPALPFNSRRVLLAMLSLPEEDRRNKRLYRVLEEDSGIRP